MASTDEDIRPFVAGLAELGYVEGRTIDIDYRFAAGQTARLQPLAQELAALNPRLVFTGQPVSARAMHETAPDLPIVSVYLNDDITDLFDSFAHPGGRVTGLAGVVEGMTAKLVEFGIEIMPGTKRIGWLDNATAGQHDARVVQMQAAARARGLTLQVETAATIDAVGPALDRLARNGPQPIVVPNNPLTGIVASDAVIAGRALADRLPTIFQARSAVLAGGLISYGIDVGQTARRAAAFADKILKGTEPGDLPIEFPTKLLLIVNLRTAKALGVSVPPILIAAADEVIE